MREAPELDRKAIHDALAKIKDVPSVIFGKATFDTADAPRASARKSVDLVVKDGQLRSSGTAAVNDRR